MSEHDLETIELSIEQAQKTVDMMNAVLTLSKDKNFEKVIHEGYFEKEASRLVLLKADPAMQKDEDQLAITKAIDAIGYFRQYLRSVIQIGRMAENSLRDHEQTREEVYAEGLN